MSQWYGNEAKKALREVCMRLMRMCQHYLEGKAEEWSRQSGYYLIFQNTLYSDGDTVVLVLRARPTDDSILKLANQFEELNHQTKIEPIKPPINPQNTT
jgi:hypothetical protein